MGTIKHERNPFIKMTPEAKYWIGYLFADGHFAYDECLRAYHISLFSKDKDILMDFKNFIGEEAKFYERPTGICQVAYHSKPVTKWFMDTFHIQSKKALVLDPAIELDWDIVHGYFDGDGCIRLSLSKGRWPRYEAKFTTGSIIWANRLVEFLAKYGISSKIKQKKTAYDINISNKQNLQLLYKHLYATNTSRLGYKYNQFVALFGNE